MPSQYISGDLLLIWKSRPGRVYSVEWTPDLGEDFVISESNILADPSGTNTLIWNMLTRPGGFIRLRVQTNDGL